MLGLFGTLNMAARSLSTQRQGSEVAGHNLANVNTPGYARQRLNIQESLAIPSDIGPQGAGAEGVAIQQLRDVLLDRQITRETSVRSSLEAQQQALQLMESVLGQQIDTSASGSEGAAAAAGVGGQQGLAEAFSELFNAFQSLSTNPTSSSERQILIIKAQNLARQFNDVAERLDDLRSTLNDSLASDVQSANVALADIAKLNEQIAYTEATSGGTANDLRDQRQKRIEDLAKLVQIDTATNADGSLDLSIGGVTLVAGSTMLDTLQTYDAGGGQMLVRTQSGGTPLTLTSGSLQGTIDARDGELASLQNNLDILAGNLISAVNAAHASGYGLGGATGENFFTGTDAASIGVNAALVADPGKIQASGAAGAVGDNQVALAIAQIANKSIPALGNQTLQQRYGQTVARLGQAISSTTSQLSNQEIVERLLNQQRDSISGVSLDEEMTDLIKFQRAYEASAKLIVTVDEMLETVVNLKR